MLVNITQRLIDRGLLSSCTRCPIAQRLEELTGFAWWVTYNFAVPLVHRDDRSYPKRYLPDTVKAWLADYDAGMEAVDEIAFEFDLSEFLTPEMT